MNKIILYHYAAVLSILGFALTMNANLIPLMLLFIVVFAICAVRFAKSVQEKDAADRERIKRHGDSHRRIKEKLDKMDAALKTKMDKPKNNVRTGSRLSPEYIKMLEEKGVKVDDGRTKDASAP
ncbi:MAG: hypothetical protein IJ639_05670 [Ruminococcus sp.]|nr:hypothetical protein [Ruminococcus sp.]